MTTSQRIRQRLKDQGRAFSANDNIADALLPGEREAIQVEVELRVADLLSAMVIDIDHNTQGTARRVAKLYLTEVMRGRYDAMPSLTDFPNVKKLDQLYVVGPITVRSMCSHHLVPVIGSAWIGVIPTERVIGLSKFSRLTDWVMARPQIQEEATVQLADVIESLIKPLGLAVVVRAGHMCMTWRGVKDNDTEMVTSVMRGAFMEKPAARAEFMALVGK